MSDTGIHGAQLILLLLLLFVAAFAALARRLQTPYPIVLVIAGLLLGLSLESPRSFWTLISCSWLCSRPCCTRQPGLRRGGISPTIW